MRENVKKRYFFTQQSRAPSEEEMRKTPAREDHMKVF
jgi:hypothetical protein